MGDGSKPFKRGEIISALTLVMLFFSVMAGREVGSFYASYDEMKSLKIFFKVTEEEMSSYLRDVLQGGSPELGFGLTITLPAVETETTLTFGFRGTDQQKRVGDLSGGERNRVHLAKLLRTGGNLLLLDEPTNDLDVNTLRALEDAIANFHGSAVVVTHDRWFLDRIATHILAFEGMSGVRWFEGNWHAYEEDRRNRLGEDAAQPHRIRYKPIRR